MSEPEPVPESNDAADHPEPPGPLTGYWVWGGWVLASVIGVIGAGVAAVVLDAPGWVVVGVFFGAELLYLAVLVALSARHVRRSGYAKDLTPEQQAAAPLVLPVVAAFLAVAVLSVVGVIVAWSLNAPEWVTPLALFAPAVLLSVLAWPYLKALPERLKRAAPSPERAAALARPAASRARPVARPAAPAAFPTVPSDSSTPGRHLARRLPSADTPAGCGLLGVAGFTLFWNGIVSVFVWQAVRGLVNGNPEWFLMVFLIPFVLVGLGGFVFTALAALAWVVSVLAGTVRVEVEDHPFVPGGTCRGHLSQEGFCRLTRVGVELACEEAATYQAGTTESTDKKVVARQPAELAGPAAVAPTDFAVAVPADAMHSFKAAKNKITWTVRVSGRVLGLLPYSGSFEAVVWPGVEDDG